MPFEIETYGSDDTVAAMKQSLGADVEVVEGEEEKPAAAAPEDEQSEEPPADETDESESEDEQSEEPPAAKVKTVPKARLDEVIRQRNELRQQIAERERERAATPAPAATVTDNRPANWTGLPEPFIEQFTGNPEKYPDPYAAYAKASAKWEAAELLAKHTAEQAERAAEAQRETAVSQFNERETVFAKTQEDYHEVIKSSEVPISGYTEAAIYESAVGPQMLYYLVQHPEEAKALAQSVRDPARHLVAIGKLEARIEAGIAPKKPAAPSVPPKAVSKAPEPPSRLKPNVAPKRTARELAGSADKVVDIEYSPAYAKARGQTGYR